LGIRDKYAVIGDWYALGKAVFPPVEHLAAVEHTPAAMDDKPIAGQVRGKVSA
jgi:hypothetical protein